jgi:iron(III) transport system substrate-binding protein
MCVPGLNRPLSAIVVSLVICLTVACGSHPTGRVTVYVSTDRELAEPILTHFRAKTGIQVDAVYDTEANKTSGLVNRLIAERARPRADLFWNNETAQLSRLNDVGLLAEDSPPLVARLPVDGRAWSGFSARARVLIVNRTLAEGQALPDSVDALTSRRWKGRAAVANPHFGSTGMHFTALLCQWGEGRFREWLRALQANNVAVLPGNAQVKDAVASGRYVFGFTDTDDVNEAIRDRKQVRLVVPDQGDSQLGVLVIPNAVALIHGAPHPDNARKLMSYLLSAEVERALEEGAGAQIPIRNQLSGPDSLPPLQSLKLMKVNYDEVGHLYGRMLQIVDEEWAR